MTVEVETHTTTNDAWTILEFWESRSSKRREYFHAWTGLLFQERKLFLKDLCLNVFLLIVLETQVSRSLMCNNLLFFFSCLNYSNRFFVSSSPWGDDDYYRFHHNDHQRREESRRGAGVSSCVSLFLLETSSVWKKKLEKESQKVQYSV